MGPGPAGWPAGSVLAWAEIGLLVVLAVATGLLFGRVFGPASLVGLVLPAAIGGVTVSLVAKAVWRWSQSSALLASIAAGLVVVTTVAWRTPPTPAALGRAVQAVVTAPSAILSSLLPAPDRPALLVIVAVVTWLAAHAATELALRAPDWLLAPVAPFAVAAVVPLLLGAGGALPGAGVTAALTLAAGALVLVRASARVGRGGSRSGFPEPDADGSPLGAARVGSRVDRRRAGGDRSRPVRPRQTSAARRLRRRRLLTALPIVALAGVAPPLLGERLPFGAASPRFDPRTELPAEDLERRNPLVEVSAQLDEDRTRTVFTATASRDVELWRQVVLDRYDGVTWSASARFVPAGRQLQEPEDLPEPGAQAQVRQEIVLAEDAAPSLLPVAGRPLVLDGLDVRFDPAGGAVQAADGPAGGIRYTVESLVVQPTPEHLDVARRDRTGADAAEARAPIEDAGVLAQVANEQVNARLGAVPGGSADVRQLLALQDFFADQSRFRLATEPAGGLSLRQLTAFVTTAVNGGPSEGSVEQFAAAYAVMARTLGYPTRVVVGYRTPAPGPDGSYEVTNRDAFAWTEVKLEGLGWVPFLARPVSSQEEPPPLGDTSETTSTTEPAGEPIPAAPADTGDVDAAARGGGDRTAWLVGSGATAGAAALAVGLGPAGMRWWRRRRRAARPQVALRIDGAWEELLDRLAAYGVPVTRAMTTSEVVTRLAAHATRGVPLAPATRLAALVNTARFGPASPPDAAGREAWSCAEALGRWARRRSTRGQRLRAWFWLPRPWGARPDAGSPPPTYDRPAPPRMRAPRSWERST